MKPSLKVEADERGVRRVLVDVPTGGDDAFALLRRALDAVEVLDTALRHRPDDKESHP